jgi:hypothetical protein
VSEDPWHRAGSVKNVWDVNMQWFTSLPRKKISSGCLRSLPPTIRCLKVPYEPIYHVARLVAVWLKWAHQQVGARIVSLLKQHGLGQRKTRKKKPLKAHPD